MFHLTLPSNSSMDYFPDNTLTHFVTHLPHELDLEGEWEVGISEIQYPHTWYNVMTEEVSVSIHYPDKNKKKGPDIDKELKTAVFTAPEGYYSSTKKLIGWLEKMKTKSNKDFYSINVSDIHHKSWINVNKGCHVVLSKALMDILGFRHKFMFSAGAWKSDRPTDITRGFNAMYVYCPLVESRIVGDVHAPLLRIIPVTGKDTHNVTKEFEPIQYVPLVQRKFQTIEIDIRDDTGKPVPFNRGRVVVTLHCRKRERSYLS